MSQHARAQGVVLRPDFGRRRGARLTAQPGGQELERWLGNLGQLRAPTALDRTIVDTLHQDVARSARSQPFLLWAVTLCCVVPVVMMMFHADVLAPSPRLTQAPGAASPVLRAPALLPSEPAQPTTKIAQAEGLAPAQTTASKPLTVRPLETYHSKVRSALAPRVAAVHIPNHATPDVAAPLRLAVAAPRPLAGTSFWPTPPSVTSAEVLPAVAEVSADVIPAVSARSWSSAGVATTPIRLQARTSGMVSPVGLLASVPPSRDAGHRPIYKRPWFLGVLGVAATGLAAGVTAAVVSSQQAQRGTAGYPLTISLGPT